MNLRKNEIFLPTLYTPPPVLRNSKSSRERAVWNESDGISVIIDLVSNVRCEICLCHIQMVHFLTTKYLHLPYEINQVEAAETRLSCVFNSILNCEK